MIKNICYGLTLTTLSVTVLLKLSFEVLFWNNFFGFQTVWFCENLLVKTARPKKSQKYPVFEGERENPLLVCEIKTLNFLDFYKKRSPNVRAEFKKESDDMYESKASSGGNPRGFL